MKGMWILRGVLIGAGTLSAGVLSDRAGVSFATGALAGLLVCALIVFIEIRLEAGGMGALLRAGAFLAGGLAAAWLVSLPLNELPFSATWRVAVSLLLFGAFGYLSFAYALKNQEPFTLGGIGFGGAKARGGVPKILDTSVIIDGRIAEVCETGFLDGPFIVPRFVLQELQRIADSGDPLKRERGRRGLDILNRLQRNDKIDVAVTDREFPLIPEVDEKLVALAKEMNGKVVTNDYNLNKVAEFQQVAILNLNDLAGSLKPAVLPGESLTIKVVKEGREASQGVGYLEDGTMVVVENGRKLVGQTAEVTVSSVVQTSTGRMMFARKPNGN